MRIFNLAALGALTAFAFFGLAVHVQAQTVPAAAINGAGSVSRAQQEAPVQQPDIVPESSSNVKVRPAPPLEAPAGAEHVTFVLRSLTLDGARVYHASTLDPYYQQLIGKQINLADIYRVANVLTAKYRNDGYVLTRVVVPPQTISGGNVHLRVVEGYIDNIEVRGVDRPRAARMIEAMATRVHSDGAALNIKDLEDAMLVINDLPGVAAQGVLSPSTTKIGAADLLVTYTRKDYNGQVGVDNYGSRFIGPWEASAALSLNSVFGLNERITGQIVTAPDHGVGINRQLDYGGLDWTQPILDDGTTAEAFGSYTHTRPSYLLTPFDVEGDATLVGLRLNHPFIRTRDLTLTDRFTLDYNNVTTSENIAPTLQDRIRTARFGGRVEFNDTLVTAAHSFLDAEVSHGLDILGARSDDEPNVSHFGAKPNFTKFTAEAQRLQSLLPDVNVLVGVIAQYSPSTLYTAEQLGIGGINYGRGYDPSQLVGDSGIAGKAELQWNNPIRAPQRYVADYQIYSFLDSGRVWNHSADTSSEARSGLTSTGVGLRSDFQSGTSGNIMASYPLTRGIESEDDKHDIRIQGAINQKF